MSSPYRYESLYEFAERIKNRQIPIKVEEDDEPVCERCGRPVKPAEGRLYCADCASETSSGGNY
jgi:predicted amidophosphoribosyltransferase